MERFSYLGFVRFPRKRHWVSQPHYVSEGYTPCSWILTQSFLCMYTVEKQVYEYKVGYRSLWQNVCRSSFSEHTPDQWWDVWRLVDDLWPNFEMQSSPLALLQLQSICMVTQLRHWPQWQSNQLQPVMSHDQLSEVSLYIWTQCCHSLFETQLTYGELVACIQVAEMSAIKPLRRAYYLHDGLLCWSTNRLSLWTGFKTIFCPFCPLV